MQIKRQDTSDSVSLEDMEWDGETKQALPTPTESQTLPMRPKDSKLETGVTVQVHPLPSKDAVLVSIQPPIAPEGNIRHVPCDIVLVIDVSGSMASAAPLPDVQDAAEKEAAGLSILDLTKHAARTILETLHEGDRLGIVTFASNAEVIQSLIYMTPTAKKQTWTRINSLFDQDCTNLWDGIKKGLQLFDEVSEIGNVQGMFVLTDGMPNHMCPTKGYVNTLRPILATKALERSQVPSIHTFGFGYSIRSELMQSIAEVGNGNYAFIPDAGMIGTVFVHAVANLYSTFGTAAMLEVQTSQALSLRCKSGLIYKAAGTHVTTLDLGNLQYGQSRDIVFECEEPFAKISGVITANLVFKRPSGEIETALSSVNARQTTKLPTHEIAYHLFRTELCRFLSSLFPLGPRGEHTTFIGAKDTTRLEKSRLKMEDLVDSIRSSPFVDDPNIQSLLSDLVGEEPIGQIEKALDASGLITSWQRWGRHYLPSLLHAHMRQVCNSFKDPGPLCYGTQSPLFIACRDELDAAFDNLPPPKPTRPPPMVNGMRGVHKSVHMSRYNHRSNPCFDGQCRITLNRHGDTIAIQNLRTGMSVWTPEGCRAVKAIVRTRPHPNAAAPQQPQQQICRVGSLWVTPWHPIRDRNNQNRWVFPTSIAEETKPCTSSVYSVMLAPSPNPNAHIIIVEGQECVTLGHGIETPCNDEEDDDDNDVRGHAFFGNYESVKKSLETLSVDENGHLMCGGIVKDSVSGLANAFVGVEEGLGRENRLLSRL